MRNGFDVQQALPRSRFCSRRTELKQAPHGATDRLRSVTDGARQGAQFGTARERGSIPERSAWSAGVTAARKHALPVPARRAERVSQILCPRDQKIGLAYSRQSITKLDIVKPATAPPTTAIAYWSAGAFILCRSFNMAVIPFVGSFA